MAETGSLIIRVTSDGVDRADSALRRLAASGGAAEGSAQRLSQGFSSVRSSGNQLTGVISRLDTLFTGLISASLLKQVISLSDAWTAITNKLTLATKANESLAQVQERVLGIAQNTRTSLEGTTILYSRLERSLHETSITGEQLGNIVSTINKAMIISGATTQEAKGALIQLSQAMASGVLRGQEFNSIAEQAPRITQILMTSLGTTMGGLRQLANTGQLTTDVVVKALQDASSVIDKEFGRTLPTFSQQLEMASTNLQKFAGESDSVKSLVSTLGQALIGLSNNLETVVTIGSIFATVMGARLLGSLANKAKATVTATLADRDMANQLAQTTAVMKTQVGLDAQSAASRLENAKAARTLAAAQLAVAKGTDQEAAAKTRLTTVTQQYNSAVIADINAKTRLTAAIDANVSSTVRESVARAKANVEATAAAVQVAQAELTATQAVIKRTEATMVANAASLAASQADLKMVASAVAVAEADNAAAIGVQARAAAQTRLTAIQETYAVILARTTALETTYNAARTMQANALATAQSNATAAQTAHTAAMNVANAATSRLTATMGLLRGAVGFLGGPLGVLMIAATGTMYLKSSQEQAQKAAIDYAESADKVKTSLDGMTQAQLNAAKVTAQRNIEQLTADSKDAADAVEYWKGKVEQHTAAVEKGARTSIARREMERLLKEAQDELAIATEKSEKATNNLAAAQGLLKNVMETLSPVVRAFIDDLLTLQGLGDITPKIDTKFMETLTTAGEKAGRVLDETKLKAKGLGEQAYVLSNLFSAAGKSSNKYADDIYKVSTGQITAANATTEMQKKLVELGGVYAQNYKLNESIKDTNNSLKAGAKEVNAIAKVMDDYKDKIAEATVNLNNNARGAAVLTAQNKLASGATKEQKIAVGELAGKYYDLTEAIKKKNEQESARTGALSDIQSVMDPMLQITVQADERIRQLELQQKTARLQDYQLFEDAKTAVLIKAEEDRNKVQVASAKLGEQVVSDSFGIMTDVAKTFAGEQSALYKVMFAAQKAFSVMQILAATEVASAQILAHDASIMGLGAVASATLVRTMGYASAAMVAGMALTGMAHDGIDSVPREGTWLLQKGERVLSSSQNADFTKFMTSGANRTSSASGGDNVTITQQITISGIGDADLQNQLRQAAADGAEQGYNRVLTDIASRGTIRRTLNV